MRRRSQVGRTAGNEATRQAAGLPTSPDVHRRRRTGDRPRGEEAPMTGAIAPTRPLNALDLCDRCGAPAYVRVVLPGSGELLFCAHHNRKHADALAKIAVEIQDETGRLTSKPGDTASWTPDSWPRPRILS